MKTRMILSAALCCLLAFSPTTRAAKASRADTAGSSESASRPLDFPPGTFTDGGHYHVSDFEGKVVVLYFGCPVCPTNRGTIPGRNKVVEQFRDKPVKFLAITPVPLTEAKGYATETKLEMPCFADGLGVMQARFGTNISLKNIYQVFVINPQGKVVGRDMSSGEIESAIKDVKWKYKDDGYDPKLSGVVDLLEWNQFAPAMQALRPLLKQKSKTGDSARTLYAKVKSTEGAQWATDADAAAGEDKAKAFDLYSRLAACFPEDDLGKHATEAMKKLRADKAITSEMAARQMYGQLYSVMSKAAPNQKAAVINYCMSIGQKYPDAPTGKAATELAQEIQQSKVAE